jgi:hypothetical protein
MVQQKFKHMVDLMQLSIWLNQLVANDLTGNYPNVGKTIK